MATNVTLPDAQARRAVERYLRAHHKGAAPQTAPRPERKMIVRPPHFEPGTSPEEKSAALLAAGFVEDGRSENGNPLFRHPQNPGHFAPFELFLKKMPERAPAGRKPDARMMNALAERKPEPVRVTADGQVVPADGKHTHKHRKVHGRPHYTEEQIAAHKAARAAKMKADKGKKRDDNADKSAKSGKHVPQKGKK